MKTTDVRLALFIDTILLKKVYIQKNSVFESTDNWRTHKNGDTYKEDHEEWPGRMSREGDMKADPRVDSILLSGKGVYRNPS